MTTKDFLGRKKFCPPKWPKMVKIWPFLAKIAIFECFWPISFKHHYKFSWFFGMETTLVVFFEKIIVYMPGKFWDGQNLAIFWPKLTVLIVFDLKLSKTAMNLPNFWYGSCSYGPQNHTLYAGKLLIWWIFGHEIAKFCPFKDNF